MRFMITLDDLIEGEQHYQYAGFWNRIARMAVRLYGYGVLLLAGLGFGSAMGFTEDCKRMDPKLKEYLERLEHRLAVVANLNRLISGIQNDSQVVLSNQAALQRIVDDLAARIKKLEEGRQA